MAANTHPSEAMLRERTFVLGTRQSKLALWQANFIAGLLQARFPAFQFRFETFVTTGDRRLDKPLPEIGGKGLFTQELEEALHESRIDFVVHSLKDLPVEEAPGLTIAAIPERENPHDVLIAAQPWTVDSLPHGARVGTSSLRRSAQLLHHRPDLTILPLRGNVDTRLRKALDGEYEAIVLAAAGVHRLGLAEHIRQEIPFDLMLPAPGQAALAVQCRVDDAVTQEILQAIDHLPTRLAVTAERTFLQGMGGGCSAPIAGYAHFDDSSLWLTGLAAAVDGGRTVTVSSARGIQNDGAEPQALLQAARQLGLDLASQALDQGARDLLTARPPA